MIKIFTFARVAFSFVVEDIWIPSHSPARLERLLSESEPASEVCSQGLSASGDWGPGLADCSLAGLADCSLVGRSSRREGRSRVGLESPPPPSSLPQHSSPPSSSPNTSGVKIFLMNLMVASSHPPALTSHHVDPHDPHCAAPSHIS